MEDRQIEGELRRMVTRHRRTGQGSIEPAQTLAGDLGFDSMAFLMLLSDVESRFGLEVPVDRIDELRDLTFAGLVDLVRQETGRSDEGGGRGG